MKKNVVCVNSKQGSLALQAQMTDAPSTTELRAWRDVVLELPRDRNADTPSA